jgi:thiol-disulfide isomerase/thioredoxin
MRAFLLLITTVLAAYSAAGLGGSPARAPEFTHTSSTSWINTAPLTIDGLRGRVVLIEFWTFDCINCRRTLPWLKSVHEKYASAGLTIVGVHTPEFAHERDVGNIREAIRREGIQYAVMVDNDYSYWNAFGNRYWPAIYLVDRNGRIAATTIGEVHHGTARGDELESRIKNLLDLP